MQSVYVCVYIRMYVCVHVRLYIIHAHKHTCIHIYLYINTYVHLPAHTLLTDILKSIHAHIYSSNAIGAINCLTHLIYLVMVMISVIDDVREAYYAF